MKNENNLDDLLRDQMRIETSGIEKPDQSLVAEARKKIAFRKKPKEKTGLLFHLRTFFSLQIKLYQAGIASVVIAAGVFFVTRHDKTDSQREPLQYANTDTLKSSSVKQNIFLVKNFTEKIN